MRKTLPYSLKKDHTTIKKHIKEWEKKLDKIVGILLEATPNTDIKLTPFIDENCPSYSVRDISEELEQMSHEMMAINI